MFKVGLIGYGFMGKMHSQCYQASSQAKVVALTDVDAPKREEARAKLGCEVYESMDKMLVSAEIDVVDVCTPTFLHEECVLAAARAGKNIMCEKPMSLTVESCDRMIAAVEKAGVTMMIGQTVRFVPEYRIIRDAVVSGKYGKALWISASRVSPPADWTWRNWLFDPPKSGGGILDLHIHDIDYINWLVGVPNRVLARGVAGKQGGVDTALTLMEHPVGAKSYAQGSIAMSTSCPFNMSILVNCERASFRYDMALTPSLMIYPSDGDPFSPELPKEEVGVSTENLGNVKSLGAYYTEIMYFLGCLKAGKEPTTVTLAEARDAVRVCLAAGESVKTGRVVEL